MTEDGHQIDAEERAQRAHIEAENQFEIEALKAAITPVFCQRFSILNNQVPDMRVLVLGGAARFFARTDHVDDPNKSFEVDTPVANVAGSFMIDRPTAIAISKALLATFGVSAGDLETASFGVAATPVESTS